MDALTVVLGYVLIAGVTALFEDRRRVDGDEPVWVCVFMGVLWPVHGVMYSVALVRAVRESHGRKGEDV